MRWLTYEVTDPYSVSLSTDSQYSQFVNLFGDASLKPDGWSDLRKSLPHPADITLYEGHVRDFSAWDDSVAPEHRATYTAFTYNGPAPGPVQRHAPPRPTGGIRDVAHPPAPHQ